MTLVTSYMPFECLLPGSPLALFWSSGKESGLYMERGVYSPTQPQGIGQTQECHLTTEQDLSEGLNTMGEYNFRLKQFDLCIFSCNRKKYPTSVQLSYFHNLEHLQPSAESLTPRISTYSYIWASRKAMSLFLSVSLEIRNKLYHLGFFHPMPCSLYLGIFIPQEHLKLQAEEKHHIVKANVLFSSGLVDIYLFLIKKKIFGHAMWLAGSQFPKNQTQALYSGSEQSKPLDCQAFFLRLFLRMHRSFLFDLILESERHVQVFKFLYKGNVVQKGKLWNRQTWAQVLLLSNCEITGITFLSPYLSKMRITNTFQACFENQQNHILKKYPVQACASGTDSTVTSKNALRRTFLNQLTLYNLLR